MRALVLVALLLAGCGPERNYVEHITVKNAQGEDVDCVVVKVAGDFGDSLSCDWQHARKP